MSFDERIQAAVRASAAPVPEDFLWTTEQMIDRLPRKERIIVRNKLSFGLILAIILCMLTLTAVAAVLLTGQELVEQEVLPMALENDASHAAPLMFTNEELQQITALAEENGVTLSEDTMLALKNGLTVLEKEIILDIVYDDLGPDPMLWTLEEQHWFYEAMVQLGVMKVNDHLLPGEGDLTEAEALAKAIEYATAQPDDRKDYLSDPEAYTLHCSYKMSYHQNGSPAGTLWHFGFMQKHGPSYYEVLMDAQGNRIAVMWRDMTEHANVTDKFTNAELARIVALAEENGITLSSRILSALEKGEGYWEEEVIMSLAKSQFGPYPGQWTLEEQYWFEETVVAIGFKDYNRCHIPAEGEMSYEDAYAKAKAHIADQGYDAALLDDRTKYALWRSCYADRDDETSSVRIWWNFWFEPLDADLPEFVLNMDADGSLTAFTHKPGLSEALASGTATFYELYDLYYAQCGTFAEWAPDIFVAFKADLSAIDVSQYDHYPAVQAFHATEFILPPEGALTSKQASDLAMAAVYRPDTEPGGAACIMDGERAIWKIMLYENSLAAWKVEVDCMTGEVLNVHPKSETGGTWQFYVPMSVEVTIPTPNPEGNG